MASVRPFFTPKLWLFHRPDGLDVLAGSGNLTVGGLQNNAEQFDLLHAPGGDALAVAVHQDRFAHLVEGAVALEAVLGTAYWKRWIAQMDRRRELAAQERELDEELRRAGDASLAVELLYADLVQLYERTKAEVRIPAPGGGTRPYVASYFKRAIDDSHGTSGPVPVVARMVQRPTEGFNHLAAARRPDLMVETLVLDPTNPYHRLFSAKTIADARANMNAYKADHETPS